MLSIQAICSRRAIGPAEDPLRLPRGRQGLVPLQGRLDIFTFCMFLKLFKMEGMLYIPPRGEMSESHEAVHITLVSISGITFVCLDGQGSKFHQYVAICHRRSCVVGSATRRIETPHFVANLVCTDNNTVCYQRTTIHVTSLSLPCLRTNGRHVQIYFSRFSRS